MEFEEKEKRIYDFLDKENIEFVIVDQLDKYNEKLKLKKLKCQQGKVSCESPLMKRRLLKGMTMNSPMLRDLSIKSCLSMDNLENIININLNVN